jgi:hypothetical protein
MQFHRFAGNAVVRDSVLIGCKAIARTTPLAIANNCEAEASNRSWRNAIPSMEVGWVSIVGSLNAQSVGYINSAAFACDANAVMIFMKPSSPSDAL